MITTYKITILINNRKKKVTYINIDTGKGQGI